MPSSQSKIVGNPSLDEINRFENAAFHTNNFITVLMDSDALYDPETLDLLLERFPKNMVKDFDLFLILAECMANAVSYGEIKAFGLHARKRSKVLLVSLYHEPSIGPSVDPVMKNAHDGWLPDYDTDPPSGLGFPILYRLAYQVTVSLDRSKLQLWIRIRNAPE